MADELEPWPLNGYAPGGYHCKCHECGKLFEGDKRAVTCLVCAVVLSKRAARLSRPSTAATDDMVAAFIAAFYGIDPDDVWTKQDRYADVFRGLNAALGHPSPQGGAEPGCKENVDGVLDRSHSYYQVWLQNDGPDEVVPLTHPIGETGEAARIERECPYCKGSRPMDGPCPRCELIGETGGTDELVAAPDVALSTLEYYRAEAEKGWCKIPRRVVDDAVQSLALRAAALTSLRAERDDKHSRAERYKKQRQAVDASLAAEKLKTAELERTAFNAEQKMQQALYRAETEAELAGDAMNDKEALEQRVAALVGLLRRYRNETPVAHQPHMIAHEVDATLATEA